jgi:integrase
MTTNRASCGFRFPAEVILWAVRWYLQSPHQLSQPQSYGGRGFRLFHFDPFLGQSGVCKSLRAMSSTTARATKPAPQNGTVPPRPVSQAQRRPREYLTPKEVERLIATARQNRSGHRDATLIRVAYRHGLRVSELCTLRWNQVDFEHGLLHVRRIKNGMPSVHPLGGGGIRKGDKRGHF